MNNVSGQKRNRGIFLVEFTCALVLLALFLLFISELIIWQTVQGHIHNLSYSGATLIKERSRLFKKQNYVTRQQALDLFTQLRRILERSYPSFIANDLGLRLDQVSIKGTDGAAPEYVSFMKGIDCASPEEDPGSQLRAITQSLGNDKKIDLYQVTVCYRVRPHSYWFGNQGLVFQSRSIMPGR